MSRVTNRGAVLDQSNGSVIHVRFGGRSFDVSLSQLPHGAGDDASIKRALATHLEVPANHLDDHVIDRHANGNLTLRPEAVFG